jgi:hypothetical protein
MDGDMLNKPAKRPVSSFIARRFSDFCAEEEGGITIFVIFMFVLMIIFGGIAVDVMRYEWRRVTLQETMDRAMLAAASLVIPPSQSPQSVAQNWFDVAGLGDELTVDFSAPVLQGEATSSSREVTGTARVRSYNHFMHMVDIPWFEGPVSSAAQQGVSKIEVMLVLDVTGSMGQPSGSTTKIQALRTAATNFVNILKFNRDAGGNYSIPKDPNNLISIGMVPYAANVNIPVELRNQFTVSDLSSWDGVPNAGVPDANCLEIPVDTWGETGLSRTRSIPMMAVADATPSAVSPNSGTNSRGGFIELARRSPLTGGTGNSRAIPYRNDGWIPCTHGDNPSTPADETTSNLVVLPTTVPSDLTTRISQLQPLGATSIAVGMRWGTALLDESARPIYTALRSGVPGMEGRPVDNSDVETRKIIVLMTDGEHWLTRHIRDGFKSGLSPIWRGSDGNFAIRYVAGGPARTGGTRGFDSPNTCSGWPVASDRQYFVPHLKADAVRRRANSWETEGNGTGTNVTGGCDPRAWLTSPTWSGSGTVRQLDWSEVWRHVRVDWVVEQLYMRSGVSGTLDYNTVYNMFVGNYLSSTANMDALLDQNCTAAKSAGFEVFGIVLGDNVTEAPVRDCSSPGTGYYYRVTNADNLNAAFEQIAVLISPLRLTQ